MSNDHKIMFWDAETSLMDAVTFGIGKNYLLSNKNLLPGTKTKIICIAYRFKGDKKTKYVTWDKQRDDRKELEVFMKDYEKADVTVGQNHKWFDTRHVNTRLCDLGMPPMPIMQMEDLLLASRKAFYLPCYKLEYMLEYFNLPHKLSTSGLDLWVDISKGYKPERLRKEMLPYCINDAEVLEPLYNKIAPYVKLNYNKALGNGDHIGNIELCPSCGVGKLAVKQYKQTSSLGIRMQLQCKKCGKHLTTGKNLVKEITGLNSSEFAR